MHTDMDARIKEDVAGTFTGKPLLEMRGSTYENWLGEVRIIDRIEALRLISFYSGHVTVLDREPSKVHRHVPDEITTFADQVDWLLEETSGIADNNIHWNLMSHIKNGIRVFVYDFTYVEVTEVAEGDKSWFDIKVFSIYGGDPKIRMMSHLLQGLLSRGSWLDEPDLKKMIHGLGV